MPAHGLVTEEEHREALRRIDRLEQLLTAHISARPTWLRTAEALAASGISRRETLVKYKRASRPGVTEPGRITWQKDGTSCLYLLSSCIDYAQARLGQPTLLTQAA